MEALVMFLTIGAAMAALYYARQAMRGRMYNQAWSAELGARERTIAAREVEVERRAAAVAFDDARLKPQRDLEAEVQKWRDKADEARWRRTYGGRGLAQAAKALLLESKTMTAHTAIQYAPPAAWEPLAQELMKLGLWPPTLPDAAEAKGEEQVQ
jgi:hypothetical protein